MTKKRVTISIEEDLYLVVQKTADEEHRTFSGEVELTLRQMYMRYPYLLKNLAIAERMGMSPDELLGKLLENYVNSLHQREKQV